MITFNGKEYARVSEIIKPYSNFGSIDPTVLEAKANLGTRVHSAISDYLSGELPFLEESDRGYYRSFLKWHDAVSPVVPEKDTRYYDDNKMITGAIDALAVIGSSEVPVLVDFKTSAQESTETWPMQAHLYYYLLTGANKTIADRFLFIKLDKYGNLPMVFEYKFSKNTMAKCMNAIDLFWNDKK